MNDTKHTPGSWYAANTGSDQGLIISEQTGRNIAVSYRVEDAALIAAAPDLLDALIRLVDHVQETYPYLESERGRADIRAAWAAITRATE